MSNVEVAVCGSNITQTRGTEFWSSSSFMDIVVVSDSVKGPSPRPAACRFFSTEVTYGHLLLCPRSLLAGVTLKQTWSVRERGEDGRDCL